MFGRVEEKLKSILGDALSEVFVFPSINDDGNKIVVVEIVYDSKLCHMSGEKIIKMTEQIWTAIAESGQEDLPLPVTHFISKTDYEGLNAA